MKSAAENSDGLLISLRNVSVSYWLRKSVFQRRRFMALKDISFDLHQGDSLAVIGKNAGGKSTLLMILAGVMSPDSGTMTCVEGLKASLLSLHLGFLPHLSGRENATLSGLFMGMKKKEIDAKLDNIIEFSELGEFINEPVGAYSSGMRTRLGLAVAFQIQPDVLLIDEVISAGDAAFQKKSFAVMRERVQSKESTIVLVSHSMGHVRQTCERAIWVDKGEIVAAGDTDTVVEQYLEFVRQQRQ